MIANVKIIGAGSIGNHLANASRRQGWSVTVCDIDAAALERTRTEIYPARYGSWDEAITLCAPQDAPKGGFDLICIGTPPDVHMDLALAALEEKPAAILVEKPLCGPALEGAETLRQAARDAGVRVFTGYDHVVGAAAELAGGRAASGDFGDIATLDVDFREYWGGIFSAHPWLAGPWESYLGFSARGGGASGEHSHAINLWQHFAHELGAGRVVSVSARMDWVRDGRVDYDRLCAMHLETEAGLIGQCTQDVVTKPTRKSARLQFGGGFVEWHCGAAPGIDRVIEARDGEEAKATDISKTRPDDFIRELLHIDACLDSGAESPISLERGLDTMLVIAAAHLSDRTGRRVRIDHSKGCRPEALSTE
ncbi:Gfo/Idh/MocA family protein [Roseicyclus sp.]|uniref:Gfo/Idh/MocA family protein n=1 Tax=Roseicyclus sp. TaxID=1914329 RepID=UPI003FA0F1F2